MGEIALALMAIVNVGCGSEDAARAYVLYE
jgi:hypothetical protein